MSLLFFFFRQYIVRLNLKMTAPDKHNDNNAAAEDDDDDEDENNQS